MKKILFITDVVWPYNKGGKEKRLFDISTRLSKYNDVHIFTMKWWNGSDVIEENGLTLHAISPKYLLYSGKRRSIKEGLLFGLACLNLIKESWDEIDVDHMPFFPLFTTKLICLIKGKKMTATWHEVWGRKYWVEYMGFPGNISYLIEKLSVLMPDKIVAVSTHTAKKLKKVLGYKKTIVTILDGIDLKHIQKIPASKTKSDLIFAGRLLSHKNVDILIKSVDILRKNKPDLKCLIIGEGPERTRLEKLAAKLKLTKNIKFTGFIENHDKVLSLIKTSKVFVLPSNREGFGIVTIESFACGTPVVTINAPDNASKDLIKDGVNGYISEPDQESLARIITKVFKNHSKMNPKKGINKYDWQNII